ncbi:glycoside hydrolase family 16 protein [Streptomyces sp. NPDC001941]|uniref:glycoside hydrolase family 16 protein n=1 Tax=Streptomyces sp. NPDC001941 TaxID=3154659 RepID=UPI003324FD3E
MDSPRTLRRPGRRLLLSATAVLSLAVGLTALPAEANAPSPRETTVLWEPFDGPEGAGADPALWTNETGGHGYGNNEREYYTPGNSNARLNGQGQLVITARRENPADYPCWYGTCQYTSARLNSLGKFQAQYGRVEANIKIPRGQGIWPAFWMLGADFPGVPWPDCGEIDIMENVGKEPSTVHGTVHGPGYSGAGGITSSYSLPGGEPFADGFHTYAVDWAPGRVTWLVDGVAYRTLTRDELGGKPWVFDKPFFLILNLAVGGAWPGDPDGSTTFPQEMVVDYVKVSTA